MENWVIYGLLASLFWGSYIISAKVASSKKYFGINPFQVSLFMLIGIAIVFLVSNLYFNSFQIPKEPKGIFFAILAGVLWALGMIVSLIAITKGADVSKLAPLFNSNTLVAVFLGMILLKEVPSSGIQIIKILAGSLFIMIGAILVSF